MRPASIYTGRWNDHSYSKILGDRITLENRDAVCLIAFIALFDALVGTVVWNIVAYFWYAWRAKDTRPRDGLHQQIQVLLRNSTEPLSFIRQITAAGWRWRGKAPRALSRILPISLIALIVSLASSIAGILSSQIAIRDAHVLLTGSACGTYNLSAIHANSETNRLQLAELSEWANLAKSSVTYASTCYTNPLADQSLSAATRISPEADCDFYVKPALNFSVTTGHECPFADPSICSVPESDIVQLDTGYLDTDLDLGINGQKENRVLFRRVNTCSPLTSDGFSNNSFFETSFPGLLSNTSSYNYGSWSVQPLNLKTSPDMYESENTTFFYPASMYEAGDVPYYLISATTLWNFNLSRPTFKPVSRVSDDNAIPMTLMFLGNRVYYSGQPVTDPWFAASEASSSSSEAQGTLSYYYSPTPGRVLGCLEQAQFCNPVNNQCTDLNSWWSRFASSPEAFAALGMNTLQQKIAYNIALNLAASTFDNLIYYLGENLLDAFDQVASPSQAVSPPLPSNQWQIEVTGFMNVANTLLQRLNLAMVTGPTSQYLAAEQIPYASKDTVDNGLCTSQKVKSTAYQSFSVLGLTLNFVLGVLIMVVGLMISYIIPAVEKRRIRESKRSGNSASRAAWLSAGALQLQRLAYEQLGLGDWEGDDDTVPVTRTLEKFTMPMVGGIEVARKGPLSHPHEARSSHVGKEPYEPSEPHFAVAEEEESTESLTSLYNEFWKFTRRTPTRVVQ